MFYSDWQLGAIQIDLTPLTLSISEDSAKELTTNHPIELNSQHVSLVGENGAEFLIGALRSRAKFSPIRAYLLILTKVRFIWKIQ